MGGIESYPYQVVQFGSPSTDGGGGAGEHIQHKSDPVDTLMGCPGPILAIFFGTGNRIKCSQLHLIETFSPPFVDLSLHTPDLIRRPQNPRARFALHTD